MFKRISALPPLDYRASRALHICIIFSFTIILQELLAFPQAGWTGFAVMMIYAGFDNGTTLFRAYHRFWGMLLGLLSGYILWFICHLDYRLLIIIIPLTVFFAYFLIAQAYSVPTVFTVNSALIGTGYFAAHSNLSVTFFIVDYTLCTLLAFAICLGFEFFWFGRVGMMNKFIAETEQRIISELRLLVALLNQEQIRQADWLKGCIRLNRSLNEANLLLRNSEFEYSSTQAVGKRFNQFVELINQTLIGLKALYSAYYSKRRHHHNYANIYQQVQFNLADLELLIGDGQIMNIRSGAIHEAHT